MPDILEMADGGFNEYTQRYIECTWGTPELAWEDTDTFYHVYAHAFSIDTFTPEDIYELNKLEIYDGSQYWEEEIVQGLESSGTNNAAAVANGPILGTYTLEYEEQ